MIPNAILRMLQIVVFSLTLVSNILFASSELYPEINPSPVYTPDEVVGIQMRALGKNDVPYEDAGIELTFRFASPGNKQNTGPLERFKMLFDNPGYGPMLKFETLEIGDSVLINNFAKVPVIITDLNGNRAAYMFTLSKQQSAPYADCWMTDSVVRVRIPDASPTIL